MILDKIKLFGNRLAQEPPLRLFSRFVVKNFSRSMRTKAQWDAVARPQYLVGMLAAADQAVREQAQEICAIEFGVAQGHGLIALQQYAEAIESETKIKIKVYGFDSGVGLPSVCDDYRDHPDQWRDGDYRMDVDQLRRQLTSRTELILGDVRETVPKFVNETQKVSIGFLAMDLDLYSSTQAALQVLSLPGKKILRRVPMYFDDVRFFFNHRFAGELLAIEEFNEKNPEVKIDVWRGLPDGRVFPENPWLRNMYVAHDLRAITNVRLQRAPAAVAV